MRLSVTQVFTLPDVHAQAQALAHLPALGSAAFPAAATRLLQRYLQAPPEGIRPGWPASRRHGACGYSRADDSAFYPANLAYLLQGLAARHPARAEAEAWRRMAQGITEQYRFYRSVPGLWSYAFYQTRPHKRWFPFGHTFRQSEHFRPPDDPDDTALIYLTLPHTPAQQTWLRHQKLPSHAGQVAGPVPHTRSEWQGFAAYTTFFSQGMPLSFDVGVLANVMNWVLTFGGPLNRHDKDSLRILADVVNQELILTDPYRIAPYYAHPVGLGYTLARFMAAHPAHPFVAAHRPALLATLLKLEAIDGLTGFERLAVQVSQAMLGYKPGPVPAFAAQEAADFALYRFPLGAEYRLLLAQAIAPRSWQIVRFSSPSFALGVLLERHLCL